MNRIFTLLTIALCLATTASATPGNRTLYGDTVNMTLSAHITLGADPADSSEVHYSISPRGTDDRITHLLVFLDNGSTRGVLDSTDELIQVSSDDIFTTQFSVKFAPGTANIIVVGGEKDYTAIQTLFVRNPATYSYSLLPVTIEKCEGYVQSGKAAITWRIAENEMTREYVIEKGTDGVRFSPAGSVIAAKPTGRMSYEFVDSSQLRTPTFYRIKFLPSQGHRIEYSKTILLKPITSDVRKLVLQNPVSTTFTFTYNAERTAPHTLSIYTMTGVMLYATQVTMRKGGNVSALALQTHLPPATYLLQVSDGNERQVVKFVKQ